MFRLLIVFGIFLACEATFLTNVWEITNKASHLTDINRYSRRKREALLTSQEAEKDSEKENDDDDNISELEEPCSIGCMKNLEVQLEHAFPEHNLTSFKSYSKNLIEEYNPNDFESFCNVYKNASQCLHGCDNRDVTKIFAFKVLAPVESMCVTNYEAFKKYLPCINKIGNEVKEKCNNVCRDYEEYFEQLLGLGENSTSILNMHPTELRSLFKGSCLYLRCQMDCSIPLTQDQCGKEAANLEKMTISSAFSTVNDLMSLVDNNAFWPKECQDLAHSSEQ